MSGLEIAGVLLGAFPLIISGLEHWRDVARVGGFWWRVRKEHTACLREVQFHEILYKRNLKELLLPITDDPSDVAGLISNPGGKGWKSKPLQDRLESRLQDSYNLYMDIISELNETAAELKEELCLDDKAVQNRLAAPESKPQRRSPSPQSPAAKPSKLASAKSRFDYESFRLKFSLGEPVRNGLFTRLKECNERLEKLLSTSDKLSALQNDTKIKQAHALETTLKKAWKKSDRLFRAIQQAWQCSCKDYHFANLRLEHRTLPEMCFEVIFTFIVPSYRINAPWSWRRLQFGHTLDDPMLKDSPPSSLNVIPPVQLPGSPSISSALSPVKLSRIKKVGFALPLLPAPADSGIMNPSPIKLCQLLCDRECYRAVGSIGHGNDMYRLQSTIPATSDPFDSNDPLTLDRILCTDFEGYVTRRQRYHLALLLASAVAQLQFTPWLSTGLAKEDVLFFSCDKDNCNVPFHEPFIRQGFTEKAPLNVKPNDNECNFASLGILLLELCFGQRLEDHPLRKKQFTADPDAKQAFDLVAAKKWSQSVPDEGGDDYAAAVKWCFVASARKMNDSWQGEIIKNVIRPLERCQEHFKTIAAS